jgi:hypothetical protein
MNAPLRHAQLRIDPLAAFRLRAWARAILWQAGEIDIDDLPEAGNELRNEIQAAVDVLQDMAERDGLVTRLGQDAVQAILAKAFHGVRDATGWKAAAAMAWDHPDWTAAALEYHRNAQRVAA